MHYLFRLWGQLTDPAVTVKQVEERRISKLIASLTLAGAVLQGLFTLARTALLPDQHVGLRLLTALIALLVGLNVNVIARRGKNNLAVLLLAYLAPLLIAFSALLQEPTGIDNLRYICLTFAFTCLFLTDRQVLILLVFDTLLLLVLPLLNTQYTYALLADILSFHFLISALALVFAYQYLRAQKMQQNVAANEARLRAAFNASPDSHYLFVPLRRNNSSAGEIVDFRLLSSNAEGARQLQPDGDPDRLTNSLLSSYKTAVLGVSPLADFARVFVSDERTLSEYALPLLADQHEQKWYSREIVKLADSVAVTLRDITASKQVASHGRELGTQQEKVRILRSFIQDVSHDFRTPLTVMLNTGYLLEGYSQKLTSLIDQAEIPRNEVRNVIAKMDQHSAPLMKSIQYLRKLLDGMLEMTRLDHLPEYRFQHLDFIRVAHTVVAEMQPLIEQKEIVLSFASSPEALPVHVDEVALNRALHNVLDNAVQFSQPGGLVLVRTVRTGDKVTFEVQDSGIGIAADELPKIFERFYRADRARGITTGGVGLGLTIASTIVEAHGGAITVESTPDVGSTFRVTLPLFINETTIAEPVQPMAMRHLTF